MLVLAAVIFATSVPTLDAGDPHRCTVVKTYQEYIRKHTDTWAIARGLPETFVDSSGYRPRFPGDTVVSGTSHGQLVRIESVSGVGSNDLAAPGTEVAVFMWSLGADCRLFTYTGVMTDSMAHVTMTLRPRSSWVGGRPTFDVSPFGLGRYPTRLASRQEFLSVEEYAEMVSLIPDETEWAQDCRPGVTELFHWMRANRRPFKSMISGLVGLCEESLFRNARAFVRWGAGDLPSWIRSWAGDAQCSVGSSWSGRQFNAVRGRFLQGGEEQWAVLCNTDTAWRLVVLDPVTQREMAELAHVLGSVTDWSIGALARGYFYWSPLGRYPGDTGASPLPRYDAVYLTNGAMTVFYHDGLEWRGMHNECCYWNYDEGWWLGVEPNSPPVPEN